MHTLAVCYYFDSDTGLYYLKARYYDPQLCRFINSDEYASTGQGVTGTNMFAYCLNNPVPTKDTQGNFAAWVIGGLVGGLIGGAVSALEGDGFAAGFVQGAVSGAIAGAGVDFALTCVATGGLAGLAVGAVVAFGTGYCGEIAGQQARSVATGNGFKPVDSTMRRTAIGSGIINTMSFGFSSLFLYATEGLEPLKKAVEQYGRFNAAYRDSFKPLVYDVYNTFVTTHTSVWNTFNSYVWNRPNSGQYYPPNHPYNNSYYGPMRGQPMYR